jgi:hypothetical protein
MRTIIKPEEKNGEKDEIDIKKPLDPTLCLA